jgi:periplasmic protein TonB
MKKILVLLFLLFSVQTFAQKTKVKTTTKKVKKKVVEEDIIFTRVPTEAEFVGGDSAWNVFVQKNLIADVAKKNGAPAGKYTAIIKFIIDTDGSLSNFAIVTNPGYGTAEEAIRLLKTSPNWIPLRSGDIKLKFVRRQPITFVVL